MEITGIQDFYKLLSTAEVSEQYEIATNNVLYACLNHRLTKDEAVETAVGWYITREGAERLWKRRRTIADDLRDEFQGKEWPRDNILKQAAKEIRAILTVERKRKCRIKLLDADRLQVEFKDISVIFYNEYKDGHTFHISEISPLQETTIYSSPRGRKDEIYRETYPTLYEAQQRIKSFQDSDGWAELATSYNNYTTIGEKV